jgi:hypothetical protein
MEAISGYKCEVCGQVYGPGHPPTHGCAAWLKGGVQCGCSNYKKVTSPAREPEGSGKIRFREFL